jgi:Fe2+ transport system protein FeoA
MSDMGMWQGLEKATGTIANTGMKLMEMEQQKQRFDAMEADRTERLRMEQENMARQNRLQGMAIKKQEYDNAPVNIKTRLSKLGITADNEIQVLTQGLEADMESIEGDVYVPRSVARKHFTDKLSDPQTLADLATVRMQNANTRGQQLQQMLMEGKLKDEEKAAAQKELEQIPLLKEQYLSAKKRAEAQLKIKEEMPFGAAGGGVVYDKRTGKPSYVPQQKTVPERSSTFDRDYDAYLEQAKTNYPDLRPMTREEFREDQVKRLSKARTAGKNNDPLGIRKQK